MSKHIFKQVFAADNAQKMKIPLKDFFSKFDEDILTGKLHFVCSKKE